MGVKLGNGNWAVKEDKLLAYNDKSGKFFNKEFDFTRGSSATYVAKDGLIKTAGIQPNSVLNGDFSQEGAELVTNGGFDTDSNWTKGSNTTIANGKATTTGTGAFGSVIYQSISLVSGKFYKISIDIEKQSGSQLIARWGSQNAIASLNSTGTFTNYFEANSTGSQLLNIFEQTGGDFVGSIDNVSVVEVGQNWDITQGTVGNNRASFSTTDGSFAAIQQNNILTVGKRYKYSFEILSITGEISSNLNTGGNIDYTTTGVKNGEMTASVSGLEIKRKFGINNTSVEITNISVQEIQVDTPRIDFSDSPNGALLLEPSSTNLLEDSENLNSNQWVQNLIKTANQPSPDGQNNAYKLTSNSNEPTQKFINGFNMLGGLDYSCSCFVKYNGWEWIAFGADSGNIWRGIKFNTLTGEVGSVHPDVGNDYSVTNFGNGWYRLWVRRQNAVLYDKIGFVLMPDGGSNFNIFSTNNYPLYGDDVNGIYAFGFQLENKSFATSYIPTYGTTATRLAETCINSGSEQDFNSDEGVLYAEIAALANSGTFRQIAITDGTTNNSLDVYYRTTDNQITFRLKSSGTQYIFENFTIDNVLNFNKIAFKYKSGESKVFINGSLKQTYTNTTMPLNLSKLNFVQNGNPFYGKTRNLRVYTEALTDAELQELTS